MNYAEKNRMTAESMIALAKQCAKCGSEKKRIKYSKMLSAIIRATETNTNKKEAMLEDMIEKLVKAGRIIKNYDDWLDCLEIAMGEDKDKIIYIAKKEQEAIEKHERKKYKK